jgi:hypothetical protein
MQQTPSESHDVSDVLSMPACDTFGRSYRIRLFCQTPSERAVATQEQDRARLVQICSSGDGSTDVITYDGDDSFFAC